MENVSSLSESLSNPVRIIATLFLVVIAVVVIKQIIVVGIKGVKIALVLMTDIISMLIGPLSMIFGLVLLIQSEFDFENHPISLIFGLVSTAYGSIVVFSLYKTRHEIIGNVKSEIRELGILTFSKSKIADSINRHNLTNGGQGTFKKKKQTTKKIYPNEPDILRYDISVVDSYTGYEFEAYLVKFFKKVGFVNVKRVGKAGDRGIDLIVEKDNKRYGVQAKRYNPNSYVGNSAVQEAYAGKDVWGLDGAIVVTSAFFSADAVGMAIQLGVLLWDRDSLLHYLEDVNNGTPITDHSINAEEGLTEDQINNNQTQYTTAEDYLKNNFSNETPEQRMAREEEEARQQAHRENEQAEKAEQVKREQARKATANTDELPKSLIDKYVNELTALGFNIHQPVKKSNIKVQHKKMSKRFHPDNPETGDAEKFKTIQKAYKELKYFV